MLSLSALGCHAQTEVCHGSGSRSSRSNRFLTTGIERPRTGVQAEAEAVAESGCGVELPSALAAGNLLAHGDVQLRLAAELRLAAAAQLRLAAEPIGVGCGARQSESTLAEEVKTSADPAHTSAGAATCVLQRDPSAVAATCVQERDPLYFTFHLAVLLLLLAPCLAGLSLCFDTTRCFRRNMIFSGVLGSTRLIEAPGIYLHQPHSSVTCTP